MKFNKQNKKWIIGLSAFALASCFGFACGTTLSASADNEPVTPTATPATAEDFYMQGISIRYNQADGEDGIRFGTAMKKTWYDGIVDTNEGKEVTTGTVIVPTALLSSETFEGIMQAVQANDATNTQTTEILESPNSIFTEGGEKYYQTKVYMHSVPQANYNTELTAVAYVAINGEVAYYTATPCQHSVASAAKYLIENGDLNADLQDYLLNYTVTYYDTDNTVLDTQIVKYGETAEYKGETPTKEGNYPAYVFAGFGDEKTITGTTNYTAQYYSYNPHTNYYFEADKVVQLPSYVEEFGEEVLTHTLNGNLVDPANVTMPAGTYTYSVQVGDIATISDSVTFMNTADYEKAFVKGNSDQHLDYFVVENSLGNTLTFDNGEGALKYEAKSTTVWNSRLEIEPEILMGLDSKYGNLTYNSLTFDVKIPEGATVPTNWKYAIRSNFWNNDNVSFSMFIKNSEGNYIDKTEVVAGQWYNVEVVLSYYFDTTKDSIVFLYLFGEGEQGTAFVKNFTLGVSENGYIQNSDGTTGSQGSNYGTNKVTINMDGTNTSGRTNVMKVGRSSGGIWSNGRASITKYAMQQWNALYSGSDTYAYFVFDFCLESVTSWYTANTPKFWNNATYYNATTGVKTTSFTAGTWYTAVMDIKKSGTITSVDLCPYTEDATKATWWMDGACFVSGESKSCLDDRVYMYSSVPAGSTGSVAYRQGNYMFSIWANGGTFSEYTSVKLRMYNVKGTSDTRMWRAGLTGWGNDSVTKYVTTYNQWFEFDVTEYAQVYADQKAFILWGYAYGGWNYIDALILTKADGTVITLDAGTADVEGVSFNAKNTSGSSMTGMELTVETDKYPA